MCIDTNTILFWLVIIFGYNIHFMPLYIQHEIKYNMQMGKSREVYDDKKRTFCLTIQQALSYENLRVPLKIALVKKI